MTFPDVEAFVRELNEHEDAVLDAEVERTTMLVEFAGDLAGAVTQVVAAAVGVRVG